jgi:hypothetical protein
VQRSAAKNYIHRSVGRPELEALVNLAGLEEINFFKRNPHLIDPYRDRRIAVALCQGAALQYLGIGCGVNDFDVHFFYRQNPNKPRLSRAVKSVRANVGAFEGVSVDFIRTVVPNPQHAQESTEVMDLLRAALRNSQTDNLQHLSRKGVVGLLPEAVFGAVIWEPRFAEQNRK